MAANICPICSGEIMTYRRILKASLPSEVSVCQCCGARLKRSHRDHKRVAGAALGLVALAAFLLYLNARDHLAAWVAIALILGACGVFALLMTSLGWRLKGWVALDDPSKDLGVVPHGPLSQS